MTSVITTTTDISAAKAASASFTQLLYVLRQIWLHFWQTQQHCEPIKNKMSSFPEVRNTRATCKIYHCDYDKREI